MLKNSFKTFALLSLLVCFSMQSKAQDYLDTIALETCNCMTSLDTDDKSEDAITLELGVCMLKASNPYMKKLKRDFDIDFDNLDSAGEKLGEVVGLRMATQCPDALLKLTNLMSDEADEPEMRYIVGEITEINTSDFITFSLKDDSGKTNRFYWMSYINSNYDLEADYNSLKSKTVEVSYTTSQFYDPRIETYRNIYIIKELVVIE
ncbi:hypothetical protein [Croceibacter atlanticus]|jgi:hypothetical protein|uniref:Uncharacterized protein n=1 Tax=Croceibacter atlanticus (strain ATCC BAA-628 / JCM 21780 / CIP 108009 / IAM 15332 / KCTC 12090 / HTCC2559) TaxID=216432 RepID=A3UAR1_CROAH|nr:hypothetical protein [Croceibacter atlanticus]EAP86897.1 hypothetical protein CA2559_12693 [Croceibacter atlanticus HTCC2559]MBW4970603.1 hypothetical protein [Croceibacter atlanticus]